MKILIYPHAMELGGSQLNAIELAGELAGLGHDVAVISEPGPLTSQVADRGLEHIPIPAERRRPSPEVLRVLWREARRRRTDIVHGFEWPPALEAWTAFSTVRRPLAVASIMSMSVAPFLPRDLPITVGTRDLLRTTENQGFRSVQLLEPPIDTQANSPGFPVTEFRAMISALPRTAEVVVVSRLAIELKLEGLFEAVEAVATLPPEYPARLVVVGDGPGRQALQSQVERANARAGREAAVLLGEMRDPRSAYSAATVCLGMGGSALRAMSIGKPLIVQGERGFWRTVTPDTAREFLQTGWYGIGDGTPGVAALRKEIIGLLTSTEARNSLGDFGRSLVCDSYSLDQAAASLAAWYEQLLASPRGPGIRLAQASRSAPNAARFMKYKVIRRHQRHRGAVPIDDFNAVAPRAPTESGWLTKTATDPMHERPHDG